MLIYATADDLTEGDWVSTAPDGSDALLRRASGLVRQATRAALYDVDSAGKPSDPELVEAFRDATCAQVAFWVGAGIDPARPIASIVASKSMGDRSVTFANADLAVQRQAASVIALVDEAHGILADAGLLNGQPGV